MVRIWRLGVLGIIALLEIGLVMALYQSPFQAVREMDFQYFMVFCLCFATIVQLTIASSWLLERRLLSISALAVGDCDVRTGQYTFCEESTEDTERSDKLLLFSVSLRVLCGLLS